MFAKWKIKRERKKLQEHCPHEFHRVGSRTECDMYDCWTEVELYCPLCDLDKQVSTKTAEVILAKQKIKKSYEEDFRIN